MVGFRFEFRIVWFDGLYFRVYGEYEICVLKSGVFLLLSRGILG